MNGRVFGVIALVLGILAAPLVSDAQQLGKMARIGYLSPRSGPSHFDEAFKQGLRGLGYVEGQNITIEHRWAHWKLDRLSDLVTELVRLKVDVIVSTGGHAPALAAKSATKTIPIVFTAGDPVRVGLVASLARPAGNLTGVSLLVVELNAKRLELLKEIVPEVSRVAVLVNPANPASGPVLKDVQGAAQALRVQLQVQEVRDPRELDAAFSAMARERAGALLVLSDAMLFSQQKRIVDLAAMSRLPAAYEFRESADAGGLMSYGPNIAGMYRRLAYYVDRILKGAKPGDLPVEQPTRFELVLNLKTAKALGLSIPNPSSSEQTG